MRRGTTPTHTFTLPFDTNAVSKVRVIYAQDDVVKIVKKESDAKMSGKQIVVKLAQSDTLRLNCNLKTEIQLRVVTNAGDALASDIFKVSTQRCLSDEVL